MTPFSRLFVFAPLFVLAFQGLSVFGCDPKLVEPAYAIPEDGQVAVITTAAGCDVKIVFETGQLSVTDETDMIVMEVRPPGAKIHLESMKQSIFEVVETKVLFRAVFEWKPELKDVGEYRRQQMDLFDCDIPAEFTINVVKCKYCINERDSLHSIAAQFDTHWTQIWSSNPGALVSPDTLHTGQEIVLGNIYHTQFGDTWKYLSVRFGASIDSLKTLNPDFNDDAIIPGGLEMCVMPATCPERRPAVPGISW